MKGTMSTRGPDLAPRAPRMSSTQYTDIERFLAKVEQHGSCWIWTAGTFRSRGGYGQFTTSTKKGLRAHRWLYQHLVRRLRLTETLDHLCLQPRCVNPDHMRILTQGENTREMVMRRQAWRWMR